MLSIVLGVIAIIAAFCYYCVYRPKNYFKDRGVTQGKPNWIFGHGFGVFTRTQSWAEMLQNVYQQSPGTRYTGMYHLNYPILVIKDPDLLRQMFIKDFDHFTDHIVFLPVDNDPLWGKNLFALRGKPWRDMRSLLSPSFTSGKLRSMFGLIKESTESFIQYFVDKDEDIITIEMKDTFTRFSSDIIATTACGIKVDSLNDKNNEFYRMGQAAIDFNGIWKNVKFMLYNTMPSIRKVLNIQLFSKEVSDFFRGLVNETIKVREEAGVIRPDLIHLLLQARKGIEKKEETASVDTGFATAEESFKTQVGNKDPAKEKVPSALTNEDITAQALVFFIAGFDSVSSLMCFTTYELTVNPDIQHTLRDEILSTWKACDGKLTYEALLNMKYLDMVISESLRKWPIQISVDRMCTKPYTIEPVLPGEQPVHIKKDFGLWLPIFSIHRDPDYYPDPEKFDPERFSDENKGNIKPYTYMPFGMGPRNCIGSRFALLETKIIIFHILLHFELVPVEKTDIPLTISKKIFALNAEKQFWIGMKKIKK